MVHWHLVPVAKIYISIVIINSYNVSKFGGLGVLEHLTQGQEIEKLHVTAGSKLFIWINSIGGGWVGRRAHRGRAAVCRVKHKNSHSVHVRTRRSLGTV